MGAPGVLHRKPHHRSPSGEIATKRLQIPNKKKSGWKRPGINFRQVNWETLPVLERDKTSVFHFQIQVLISPISLK